MTLPRGVILPIFSPPLNQRLPSAPAAIEYGLPDSCGRLNSLICPLG